MDAFRKFLRRALSYIKKPEMRILPGNLAFFLVLSLIPLLTIICIIISSFPISIETIEHSLSNVVPSSFISLIDTLAKGKGLTTNIFTLFVVAFFMASNGANSMIIASNEIYKIKEISFVRSRIKSIVMTFVLAGLLFFLLIVPVFGNSIFSFVKESAADGTVIDVLSYIYGILKYPLTLLLIYWNIKMLYTIAPDQTISSSSTTNGAIFTTVGWFFATIIYSTYVNKISVYNIFYGSVANIITLLLWVYILSYIFVIGLAINAGKSGSTKKVSNSELGSDINEKEKSKK